MKKIIITAIAAGLLAACSRSDLPGSIDTSSGGGVTPPYLNSSLYSGPAPRPGPDILYAPLADAPQLQNTGIWQAEPIRVSGASAYRKGEFLYQDFLYDDHGAKQLPDPNDPRLNTLATSPSDAAIFSTPVGTYTYPANPDYANNAADLVELRVKPTADATAFRVTLNTINKPDLVAYTIALGGDATKSVAWPHGANVSSPA
ncbi:MAG TPA: glucodextranase DOMON-like domain-containing protein, partial [Nevskiaceae bacterium]|nr:glucodextranase DOMON-like domain-containing protein [Nevskiaceae bacterium]